MIYYADSTKKGDGLSLETAGNFETLASQLNPGDTLMVCPGLYNYDHQITILSNGTIDEPINIKSLDPDNRPVFDFRKQPYGDRLDQNCNGFRLFGQHLILDGVVIAYAGFKGIRSELSDSILKNIEVYGSCDSGIHMCSGGNNTLFRCVSHDNFGYKTMDHGRIKFGYDSDGISDKLHYGPSNTFIECESYSNTDDGFDFYGRCTEDFTELNNCKSHDNGVSVFDMRNYPRYEIDKEWFDQFKDGKKMRSITSGYVIVSLEHYPAFGNGNGFKLSGKRRYHCVELHGCEAHNNKLKGFDQNHNSGIMKLYDCIASGNKFYDYGFREESFGNAYFENCISENDNISIKCKKHESVNCSWQK